MRRTKLTGVLGAAAMVLALAACSDDGSADDDNPGSGESQSEDTGGDDGEEVSEFFNQADMDEQDAQRDATFEGDAATPWLQLSR